MLDSWHRMDLEARAMSRESPSGMGLGLWARQGAAYRVEFVVLI